MLFKSQFINKLTENCSIKLFEEILLIFCIENVAKLMQNNIL